MLGPGCGTGPSCTPPRHRLLDRRRLGTAWARYLRAARPDTYAAIRTCATDDAP
ncbi:hypothetical protein [Streptomyces sclerotialus]|uniref:hypothetical protein n=1 Tax=Streptomyces sclerotialus TaxID=1957 RepID=UPI000B32B91F